MSDRDFVFRRAPSHQFDTWVLSVKFIHWHCYRHGKNAGLAEILPGHK